VSPEALIRRLGSTVTIRRATRTRDAADGSSVATWATIASGVRLAIQPLTERLRQRDWGREVTGDSVGFAAAGTDLQIDDGILVTAGPYAGQAFRVTDQLPRLTGPAHRQVALTRTDETFA
jgi:hypothetical protein